MKQSGHSQKLVSTLPRICRRTEEGFSRKLMPLDYQKLMNWRFEDVRQTYTHKDTILYALGLGLGASPMDEKQLRFVFEKDLVALPTMAVVLGSPGFWMKDPAVGVDWKRLLHGEQGIVIEKPLPSHGQVIGRSRITKIIDKGADKGALVLSERDIIDATTNDVLARMTATTFLRGDGGFGGSPDGAPKPHAIPDRAPDLVDDFRTVPQAALIYRLSGDDNPLHADPEVARAGGFPQPILHGLCTLGIAGHTILKNVCKWDVGQFRSLALRFTSPVFPGETIRTLMWIDGSTVSFRAKVVERDVFVLDNGRVTLA
jgi:acyl dehydratase